MYKYSFKFISIVCGCIFMLSCSPQSKGPNELSEGILKFENNSHDFGIIGQDTIVIYKFKLTNTGSEPLYIKDVKAACGCTSPDWSKESINPGDTGFVEAKFNSNKGNIGAFNKYLSVFSNTKDSIIGLFISGNIIEKRRTVAELYPETSGSLLFESRNILFGTISEKDVTKKTVKIYNNSDTPIKLIDIKNVPNYIKFTKSSTIFNANAVTEIEISINPKIKNEVGNFIERIELFTNDSKAESIYLFISTTIVESFDEEDFKNPPQLSLDKSIVSFENIKRGSKVTKTLLIKNTGAKELKIRKIEPSCTCVTAEITNNTILPNREGKIEVSYDSKDSDLGPDIKSILLYTNDPANSVYILSINANITK